MNPPSRQQAGSAIRLARLAQNMTQAELGARTGYSPSQISRYERGLVALTDMQVLRRFADVLRMPPQHLGLLPDPDRRHDTPPTQLRAAPAATVTSQAQAAEDDPVRRRQLMALTATAAGYALTAGALAPAARAPAGSSLVAGVREALLGSGPAGGVSTASIPAEGMPAALAAALADFHACRYRRLAGALPRLIRSGHAAADAEDDPRAAAVLAEVYTLATRMLIKLDEQALGWVAADRARLIAGGADDPLIAAEAARNLAVLARKAGWYDQASAIALAAADDPRLRTSDPAHAAKRGMLIMCTSYTAAKAGDRSTMRELDRDAAGIAGQLGDRVLLRDHGGGFSPATVTLHRIAAEYSIGDPGAAIAAARQVPPASLPSTERRARYWTDVARAFGHWGRRDDCLRALLAAEREAPEETHSRPAVRDLVSGLLVSGPTPADLRGLAARCGIS
uniref:helix-turn-helix domain-containing protein n=1 Tax=Pseudonocardia sp. CA-138482 TaxID=3240023 RepID=UPI003F493B71